MPGRPYGLMLGYDPYMHQSGYSRYAERAVFDYSDRRDGARYGDRPLYDSAAEAGSRSSFSRQVVDYNHGSISASSADDRGAEKEKEREQPVTSGRDVDEREKVTGTESRQTLYRSPEPEHKAEPTTVFDADVDIKFIQDTIVSISYLILLTENDIALASSVFYVKYTVFQKNRHPFCFCYNFVSRDQILVIFGCLVAKEICSCPLLTYLKEIAGALR